MGIERIYDDNGNDTKNWLFCRCRPSVNEPLHLYDTLFGTFSLHNVTFLSDSLRCIRRQQGRTIITGRLQLLPTELLFSLWSRWSYLPVLWWIGGKLLYYGSYITLKRRNPTKIDTFKQNWCILDRCTSDWHTLSHNCGSYFFLQNMAYSFKYLDLLSHSTYPKSQIHKSNHILLFACATIVKYRHFVKNRCPKPSELRGIPSGLLEGGLHNFSYSYWKLLKSYGRREWTSFISSGQK